MFYSHLSKGDWRPSGDEGLSSSASMNVQENAFVSNKTFLKRVFNKSLNNRNAFRAAVSMSLAKVDRRLSEPLYRPFSLLGDVLTTADVLLPHCTKGPPRIDLTMLGLPRAGPYIKYTNQVELSAEGGLVQVKNIHLGKIVIVPPLHARSSSTKEQTVILRIRQEDELDDHARQHHDISKDDEVDLVHIEGAQPAKDSNTLGPSLLEKWGEREARVQGLGQALTES